MKLKYLICFILSISFLPQGIVNAQSSFRKMMTSATEAYENGHYQEALDIWKEVYRSGNADPDLLVNMGNAESMLGNVPEAILSYEKALRFRPGNSEIREAIKKERNRIENSVTAVNTFFLLDWYKTFIGLLRPGIWVMLGFLFLIIALLFWLRSLEKIKLPFPGSIRKRIFIVTGILCILAGMLQYHEIFKLNEGIVFTACELRQGPSPQSPVQRTLHPGEKVMIKDHIKGWHRVNLLNLDEGWVNNECLKLINVRQRDNLN